LKPPDQPALCVGVDFAVGVGDFVEGFGVGVGLGLVEGFGVGVGLGFEDGLGVGDGFVVGGGAGG
jgi:hypothetical protein